MPQRTSKPEQTFAYAYGVQRTGRDGWFDPVLSRDTTLFIDPFLMFDADKKPWSLIQDQMIEFFNIALGHVADAGGDHSGKAWMKASAMLSFPEVAYLCLGYGKETIFGSGSAGGLGRGMLASAEKAIGAGIDRIDDFGELMLFGDHFGADRVSDMMGNLIMPDLIRYTQQVCRRHGVPMREFTVPHSGYDYKHSRWWKTKADLPGNPCWLPEPPVLLVPEAYLDELPKMDDGAFWDWVYDNCNQQLRTELNIHLSDKLDRAAIIRRAKRSPSIARRFGIKYAQRYRDQPPNSYDLQNDPRFLKTKVDGAQQFASQARVEAPADEAGFCEFVFSLCEDFKWIVEDRGLWKSFWNGTLPHREPNIQLLFNAAVVLACRERGIDLSPESDAGSGPVDFKFSATWSQRSVVELKFAKSKSYWDNLEAQTPTYLRAEGARCGTFLVVQHGPEHCTDEFMDKTQAKIAAVGMKAKIDYRVVFVDVQPKPSASKRKP